MSYILFEKDFVPIDQPILPIKDKGFLFGKGVYSTLKVQGGIPLFFELHIKKLEEQASSIGLGYLPFTLEEIQELIERNQADQGSWKLKLILSEHADGFSQKIAFLEAYEEKGLYPLTCKLYPFSLSAPIFHAKTLAHLSRLCIADFAKQNLVDDAISLYNGTILETSYGNIFWIDQGTLYTPSPSLPLHFGITITLLMEKIALTTMFVETSFEQLPYAPMFRCNTIGEILPIVQIEERCFPRDAALETMLLDLYQSLKQEQSYLKKNFSTLNHCS